MKKIFLTLVAAAALHTASAQTSAVTSAILNQRQGLLDKARTDIDGAAANPKTTIKAKTWYTRGEIYEQMMASPIFGKALKPGEGTKAAFESYSKAIELEGKDSEYGKLATQKLGNLYGLALNAGVENYNNKNFAEAISAYKMAQQIRPQDTTAFLYAAYAAEANQDYKTANETYNQLLGMNYKSLALYGRMLQIAKQQKDDAAAAKVVKDALVAYPNNKAFMLEDLNRALSSGKGTEALDKISQTIAADPTNSNLYAVRGSIYDQQKKTDLALADYKKALELDPSNFDAQFNVGVYNYNKAADLFTKASKMDLTTYQKVGKKYEADGKKYFQDSLPYFEKALQLQPNDRAVLSSLQKVYVRLGRTADAERMNAQLNKK